MRTLARPTRTLARPTRTLALIGALAGAALAPANATDDETLPREGVSPLFWNQQERIVGFGNYDVVYPARRIAPGPQSLPLVSDPKDFDGLVYQVGDDSFTLAHYLEAHHVAGLLAMRGDRILLERYRLGHAPEKRWVSYSIAKSVTSLLIGAAIRDGYIDSLDEPVTRYVPRLRGSVYDDTTIRHLLQMASGVSWNEDYSDPTSDVALAGGLNGISLFDHLRNLPRVAKAGTQFNYNTGETNLVGSVLRGAIGNNASAYLEAKIWRPFMAHDASWSLSAGVELGGCCINATLRDYARIARFALRGGVLPDGTQVLPEGWMQQATSPSPGNPGYGYLWWLWDGGAYAGIGIFGQLIWIDPDTDVVIVTHSAWPSAIGRELSRHRGALMAALRERVLEVSGGVGE